MYKILRTCLLFILALTSNKSGRAQSTDLNELAYFMAGSYTSTEQHLNDTANYFDIHLQIVPIWVSRSDGFWFYVEQAVADYLDKPYRQRIYHLTESTPGIFESAVFIFNDPLRFTHHPELVDKTLTPDSIIEKVGCTIILHKTADHIYMGGTEDKKCPSERKGATYAIANVTIAVDILQSWDRGYNEKDEQVWGAEKGGYVFKKTLR